MKECPTCGSELRYTKNHKWLLCKNLRCGFRTFDEMEEGDYQVPTAFYV